MSDLLDEPGMTVTLVPDPVSGGMHIRQWTGDLEPGTHILVPLCLAERALAEARAEVVRAHGFIFDLGCDLLHRRVADWFPEGVHNAAAQMSEDMRQLGNACADFIPLSAGGTDPEPCPVCGGEERSGAGYLLCECPAPKAAA